MLNNNDNRKEIMIGTIKSPNQKRKEIIIFLSPDFLINILQYFDHMSFNGWMRYN